jgi:hypothetical protein
MSAMVKLPIAMAFNTHERAAAWNARLHDGRQNRCRRPPLRRARNDRLHQKHAGMPFIATIVIEVRAR